eukprot:TRINITY_DN1288_c0_g1_i2.p1 TRINITY_DN1288_c0_g1~~TRINITY_DN1288_c0_g1_i2.p1  ORF type:complete len:514 (+),score=85.41 TRINITY_DN1288_c0_g1_i2:912-2453(+)
MMKNEKEGFPITAIREIKILKELNHENIIQLKEVVTSKKSTDLATRGGIYLVFEFMDHDMAGLMDTVISKSPLKEEQIKCYFKQLLEGLHYLHRNNILHRDIKASNLLINNQGYLKLADFGLARPISDTDPSGKYTNKVITLWYRPPELLLGSENYGAAIDMWSAGCILGELLMKQALFRGSTEIQQLELIFKLIGSPTDETWPEARTLPWYKTFKIKKNYPAKLKEKFKGHSDKGIDLLERLLALDPKKRIGAFDALDHAYFWSEPRACEKSAMPKFPTGQHEFTNKKRKQQFPDQSNAKRPRPDDFGGSKPFDDNRNRHRGHSDRGHNHSVHRSLRQDGTQENNNNGFPRNSSAPALTDRNHYKSHSSSSSSSGPSGQKSNGSRVNTQKPSNSFDTPSTSTSSSKRISSSSSTGSLPSNSSSSSTTSTTPSYSQNSDTQINTTSRPGMQVPPTSSSAPPRPPSGPVPGSSTSTTPTGVAPPKMPPPRQPGGAPPRPPSVPKSNQSSTQKVG